MDSQNVLTFSQEELALLVELAGAPSLPPMGSQPYGALDPATINAIRAAAQRSLIARGALTPGVDAAGNPVAGIDRTLQGLIEIAAFPDDLVFIIERVAMEPARMEALYLAPEIYLRHDSPHPGIHRLQVVPGIAELIPELLGRIPLKPTSAELRLQIPQQPFLAAQNLAEAGDPAAASVLTEHGIEPPVAEELVQSLAEPQYRLYLQVVARVEDGTALQGRALTVLGGPERTWLIHNLSSGNDDVTLTLSSATPTALEHELHEVLAPLLSQSRSH